MAKASLRELLESVKMDVLGEQHPLYPLLEALVEAVEPEDTDATIRKLRKRLAHIGEGGGVVILNLHRELDAVERELQKAQAEIERLRKRKEWWEHSIESWKAEERSWHEETGELRAEIQRLTLAYVGANERIEVLRPLAAIGRLVREMPNETCFWRRADGRYAARTLRLSILARPLEVSDFLTGIEACDPAEALRAIQEVGDESR